MPPGPSNSIRAGQARVGLCLGLVWLGGVAGCQIPAARVSSTCPEGVLRGPGVVLARQLIADTAVQLACHPIHSGQVLLSEPAAHLRAASEGIVGKRMLMPLMGSPDPLPPERVALSPAAMEAEMTDLAGKGLNPAHIDLYAEPHEALAALKQTIDGAARRIDVLMFQWENDSVGEAVAAWLAAKASPDLHVRILADGGGNLMFGEPEHRADLDVNRVVTALALQPHVEVIRTRNPFGRFDHRKLVLVDGRIAWSGGRNFTRKAFFCQHDLSFTLIGPLVDEWQQCFDSFWEEQGGKTELRNGEMEKWRNESVAGAPPQFLNSSIPQFLNSNALARLISTAPCDHRLADVLYHAVDHAQHHVYLENFIFSDSKMIYKLAQARRRGVEVRVVMTINGCTNVANRANRVVANRLHRAGVRVYLYPEMTHVKAAAVDGCWAYVGSGNFDGLSMRHNRELGVAIGGGPVIEELEQRLFQADFRPEWEVQEPLQVNFGDYACELLIGLYM